MNAKRFKVIFSKRRNALVVVGENASSNTKATGTSETSSIGKLALLSFVGALSSIFLAVHCAYAEPTGGQFVAGEGAIANAGALTTIHQTTQQAIVNWESFSSASHETIQFVQPNANAAILNRVVGSLPSQLNGTLLGNGHVYLINQNGIMLGKEGIINVHGNFVGSTRDVNNDAFMAGGALIYKGESIGDIQILGKVKSDQGDIVLIANKVDVKQGSELVAGDKVQLVAANEVQLTNGKITVKPSTGDKGQIAVEGAVQAAQVQLLANNNNLGALAINTTGTIRATGTQTNPDGSVSIIATGNGGNINISGKIRSEKGDGNGGAVTVLADNAIRVSGTIDANSDANSTDATKKGGDIIIGRDPITSKLAKATDVSGATLLSNKGFVETSGDWLKTKNVTVKAKDWLLDPTNIRIVAADSADPDTSILFGTTITFQDNFSPPQTSEVLTSTIEGAINAGTSVTISTANLTPGSMPGADGAGDITIADALTFTNNAADATLSLIADNGITQNAAISASGTKLVNISMEAKGNYKGLSAADANSKGITLNAAITTNGDVTLKGTTNNSGAASPSNAIGVDIKTAAAITARNISITGNSQSSFGIQSASLLKATNTVTLEGTSKNWVGVTTTGAITATNGLLSIKGTKGTATDASGYQGININSNLTGASVSLIGTSYGHYGVQVQNVTVKSTSGDVYIEGAGSNTADKTGQNESSGTRIAGIVEAKAKATIKGTTSDAGLYQGLIISNQIKGASVEITGIAANHIGAAVNNGAKVTASTGDVIINGTSNTNEGLGIGSQSSNGGATITATEGSVSLTGTSNSSLIKSGTAGVRFWGKNSVLADKAINITGTVDTLANKSGVGVEFQRYPSATNLKTTKGDINITGTLTGVGGGSGVRMGESGWNAEAPMISAGGNFTLRGNNRASSSNASAAISASGGMQVSAGGNIVVQAETNNNAVAAMNFSSGYAGTWSNALQANTSFIATKDVLIQANQGGIVFYNNIPSNLTNGTLTALTDIQGKNITIDNTGAGMAIGAGLVVGSGGTKGGAIGSGIIDAATGAITTAGSGGANGGTSGVSIDGRKITATDNLNIMGVAKGTGTGIFSGAVIKGSTVDMTGTGGVGKGVYSFGAITSTVGGVSIKGTVTGSSGSIGTHIQGPVTAQTDINLEGYTAGTFQGLLIQQTAVTSTAGDITVKGENKLNDGRAVTLFDGLLKNVANGKTININANTLFMTGSSTVNAGSTGTVNIKTLTPGNEIKIGSTDMGGAALASQILGIDNGELNRITAGNLVIGDTASNGKITVAAATTTQSQTGNITLQTGGNISVDQALTVADTKNLTLQAKGDVTIGAEIKRTGTGNLVIAAGLGEGQGVSTGGQVTRANSFGKITNNGSTYIYTGSEAGSAKMSDLNIAFNTLYLTASDANAQNAQSNTGTDLANTISGGANAQVMYREKIAVDLTDNSGTGGANNTLANATKTYGDVATNNDAVNAIKGANNPNKTLEWTTLKGTKFNLSSDALIGTLSVDNLASNLSTASKLKASGTAYTTTSSTYSVPSRGTAMPTLTINKLALTGASIGSASNTYGDTVGSGAVNLTSTNKIGADVLGTGTASVVSTAADQSSSGNLKAGTYNQKVTGLSGTDAGNYDFTGVTSTGNYNVLKKDITISAAGNTVIFNSQQQTDSISKPGFLTDDKVGTVVGAGTGTQAGSYQSNLALVGSAAETIDQSNYAISYKNTALTINAQAYVRPPVETTILSPVTFGLAYAGGATAAGGDGVDIASACDAWSQRVGAGSISVMTLLKPNTMGLRTAKTDTMDAMTGGSGASSAANAGESPCGSAGLANKQAGI